MEESFSISIKHGNENECSKKVFAAQPHESKAGLMLRTFVYLDELSEGDFDRAISTFAKLKANELAVKRMEEQRAKEERLKEQFELTPEQEAIIMEMAELAGVDIDSTEDVTIIAQVLSE